MNDKIVFMFISPYSSVHPMPRMAYINISKYGNSCLKLE